MMKTKWISYKLSVLAALCLGGCGADKVEESETERRENFVRVSVEATNNLDLEVVEVASGQLSDQIVLQGDIALDESRAALVPARLSGIVEEMPVGPGDRVEVGDLLAVLRSQDLAERIMDYVNTEWAFRAAMQTVQRERTLREREISSEEQLLAAEHAFRRAENAHSTALQRVRLLGYAEADLHAYLERPDLLDLTVYEVRAPLSGTVLSRNLQVGEAVEPGKVLYELADLSRLWVRFSLPMRSFPKVKEGMDVAIDNEVLGLSGTARLSVVEERMDLGTRSVAARADLQNPDRRWSPGMPVRVSMEGLPVKVERVVPRSAVHELESRIVVFVEENRGQFTPVDVKTGRQDAQQVELEEGPAPGRRVAATNSYLLVRAWETRP